MIRRSLRVWMFAFALFGSLALSARTDAKPPDLPIDPNDTVPVLPQSAPFEVVTPATYVAPPVLVAPIHCGPMPVAYPVQASPPQTVTIYHPVRPRTPLSAQRSLSKCMMFGAHPLLSLIPLPESLCEEHTQEVIQIAPTRVVGPDGLERIGVDFAPMPQVMFGVGVNSDAGLSGSVVMPELILKMPVLQEKVNVSGITLPSGHYLEHLPQYFPPSPPNPQSHDPSVPEPISQMPVLKEEAVLTCPWKCMPPCDRHVSAIADLDVTLTVLANLEKLIEAEKLYQEACELAKCGKYKEAFACLHKVAGLCPASRFEEMAAELTTKIVCKILGFYDDAEAGAEEQEEPPMPYVHPLWYEEDPNWFIGCESEPTACTRKAPRAIKVQVRVMTPCVKERGVEQQVTGLMKACHLALSCGKAAKAAELARQAQALDAKRVAADPVVYKMHLLALKRDCGEGCECSEPCGDGCDCCKPVKKPLPTGGVVGGLVFKVEPVNGKCLCVRMGTPALPPVDATIATELHKLLVEEAVATAKPCLEVVEEESEVREVPKAIAKPYCVRSSQTGAVMSMDDVLQFVPGDLWTELDGRTNQVRVLWRVRVGGAVYRLRYNSGDVSIGVIPVGGASEACEK